MPFLSSAANYGPREKKTLKRGWTQFWRGGSALLLACIPAHALAQQLNSPRKTETNVSTAATQRNDELSLAGLRPGRDDMTKAERLFRKPSATKYDGTNKIWQDPCRHQLLSIIPDPNGTIQEVRVAQTNANSNPFKPIPLPPSHARPRPSLIRAGLRATAWLSATLAPALSRSMGNPAPAVLPPKTANS